MREEWRDIKGFEGYYQVSNLGQIRSVDRKIYQSHNQKDSNYKSKLRKPTVDKHGYLEINLCKGSKSKKYLVHRLVANAFIPNPNNYSQVNHIDENKHNNFVDNLEWCTPKYNSNYGYRKERIKKARTNNMYNQKAVKCIETGRIFINSYDAERKTGFKARSIRAVCEGKYKTLHGYHWMFIDKIPDDNGLIDEERLRREKYGAVVYRGSE